MDEKPPTPEPFRLACLLTGGHDFKIRVQGKVFTFEFPLHYGGPAALTKRGDIASAQPGYFLEAASLWHQQGRRITEDGFCIWRPKPKELFREAVPGYDRVLIYTGEEEQPDQW